MEIKLQNVLHDLFAICCSATDLDSWPEAEGSFTLALLTNTHNKNWEPRSRRILVSILVSFIFRLVGYYSVVLLSNKELGKVKYCTIENHLYLWLALCVSTSSTGTSDTRKMCLTEIKESQTKKPDRGLLPIPFGVLGTAWYPLCSHIVDDLEVVWSVAFFVGIC